MSSNINLFVIYPPGLFGNHVANLISTDSKFIPRFNPAGYDNDDPTAHYNIINLRETIFHQDATYKDLVLDQSNVWAEHIITYLHDGTVLNYVTRLPNKYFLIIRLPEYDSVLRNRMSKYYFDGGIMLYNEMKQFYDEKVCSRLFDQPYENFFSIDSELIWQEDGTEMLNKIISNSPIDLNLNIDYLNNLHSKWFNKVFKDLTL
jgi:hypothetical protein